MNQHIEIPLYDAFYEGSDGSCRVCVTGTVCTLADASNPELFLPGTPGPAISPRVLPHINAFSVSTDAPGSLEASSRSEFEPMLNIPALKVD